MARVTITQADIDRNIIVPPGKYAVEVHTYKEQAAGTDGSALYVYELKVIEGAYKGAIARYQVSEKTSGMGHEFWKSCGLRFAAGDSIDPGSVQGRKVGCYIQRGEFNFRPKNEPVSFFPLTQQEVAKAPVRADNPGREPVA